MSVKVRWTTVNGEQLLAVRLPGGIRFTISPTDAWVLVTELRHQLLVHTDTPPE